MKARRVRSNANKAAILSGAVLLLAVGVISHSFFNSSTMVYKQTVVAPETVAIDKATLQRLWKAAKRTETMDQFLAELDQGAEIDSSESGSIAETILNDNMSDETRDDTKKSDSSVQHPIPRGVRKKTDGTTKAKQQEAGGQAQDKAADSSTSSNQADSSSTTSSTTSSSHIPRLTKEFAQQHARDNVIIVTWANFHFSDFALNWANKLLGHGIKNFLVGAMDEDTAELMTARNIPVFAMYDEGSTDTGLTKNDFGWGSDTFHKMGRQKVELAMKFTSFGLDLCLCDTDVVWINDPTDFFNSYPTADILASSDMLSTTLPVGDTGLEYYSGIFHPMNIGLIFFRHSEVVAQFCRAWMKSLEEDDELWDQNAFNILAHQGGLEHPADEHERLAKGFNQTLVFGALPTSSFASGHTFFVQRMFETQKVKPFVVHTTFQYGGTAGKKQRLREALLWGDPDEYYSQGKFLKVEVTKPIIPKDFDSWTGIEMVRYHIAAATAQLREVKDAIALAQTFDRTLIMPKLWCFCDRYWGWMENCRLPGAGNFTLPFICPMDHLIQPGVLESFMKYREYTFLDNPKVPKSMREGAMLITAADGVADVQASKGANGKPLFIMPANSTDVKLKEMSEPMGDAQLVRVLGSPSKLFGGFEDVGQTLRTTQMFRDSLDVWCCMKVPDYGEEPVHEYRNAFPLEGA